MKPHTHHITPRHKGGDNSPENLVLLDPLEHAEIHALRFLEGEDNWFDCRQEGWPLLDHSLRDEVLTKMSSHNTMKNPEIAAKVSKAKKGMPSPRLGVTLSDETKEKLRKANLGKTHSDESKQKMSESRTGKKKGPYKKWSDEDRQAHSECMREVWERRRSNG